MQLKNPLFFNLLADPGSMPYSCIVKDLESNAVIETLPENSRVVLFSGKQDIVYYTVGGNEEEVNRLEATNDAYLDVNHITIAIPNIKEVNTLVDVPYQYLSHTMPFQLNSANSPFMMCYYDLVPEGNEYDIIHKCAVVSNGSVTLDSNNNKIVYVIEHPLPQGNTRSEPSYTTGYDTNPLQTSSVVTVSSTEKVYVISIEYKTD